MRHKKWEEMDSEIFLKTPFFTIYKKEFRLSNNSVIKNYYLMEKTESVHMLALTKKRKVLLVKHYRPGTNEANIEIPAGYVEKKETLKMACERELMEETGYRASNFLEISNLTQDTSRYIGYPLHFFVVWGLTKNKRRKLDLEAKEIEVLEVSLRKSIQMIKKGKIKDMVTVAGLLYLNLLSQKNF